MNHHSPRTRDSNGKFVGDVKPCAIAGCEANACSKGWCIHHYGRFRRYGDPLGSTAGTQYGDPYRFYTEVVIPFSGDDCLTWPFARNQDGYGRIGLAGKTLYVSNIACLHVHGSPPTPKHYAAHSCGKGHLGCVNPRHMSWKTPTENQHDRIQHGTHNRGERNLCAKLTEEDVRQIRAMRGSLLQREIGELYGIGQRAVSKIMLGQTWSWL